MSEKKYKDMRRFGILIGIVGFLFTACEKYEDFLYDFEYSTVYFPIQNPVRTIVASNDMKLKVGVVLGGKRSNEVDERVTFEIDPELLNDQQIFDTPLPFTLLPDDYYTLSNESEMIIHKGSFQGLIDVILDSAKFVNDPDAITNTYALPFRIIESTTDSILSWKTDPITGDTIGFPKNYSVLVIKYINKFHGYYYHKGREIVYDATNTPIDTIIYSNEELVRNEVWEAFTSGGDNITTNGIGSLTTGSLGVFKMKLSINNSGTVTCDNVVDSDIQTIESGDSKYVSGDKSFFLNYRYIDTSGNTHTLTDTLIFRNDGVGYEEW